MALELQGKHAGPSSLTAMRRPWPRSKGAIRVSYQDRHKPAHGRDAPVQAVTLLQTPCL